MGVEKLGLGFYLSEYKFIPSCGLTLLYTDHGVKINSTMRVDLKADKTPWPVRDVRFSELSG